MRFSLIWRGKIYPLRADTLQEALWKSDGMFKYCRSGILWLSSDTGLALYRDLGSPDRGMWKVGDRKIPSYPRFRVGDKIYRRYAYAFRKANGDKSLIEIID